MIALETNRPSLSEFVSLMKQTDQFLNHAASQRQNYYSSLEPEEVEKEVESALCKCAIGTPFSGKITLVSGVSFPDIVARDYYGVEVKSTNKNKWSSTGSSILESTRIQSVERIFLTFGKLGKPVEFMSRPYEECLAGISVTHYPRYQIDMELQSGETIFDKMNIRYDEFRKMDNPVLPVSTYYKSKLRPGQSLWWSPQEIASPPILRLWSTLPEGEKRHYTAAAFVLFPEVFAQRSAHQYERYVLWMAMCQSIINPNVRDQFSAGGAKTFRINGREIKIPAVLRRMQTFAEEIMLQINSFDTETLQEFWPVSTIESNRMSQWINIVSDMAKSRDMSYSDVSQFLRYIFCVPSIDSNSVFTFLPVYSLRAACGRWENDQVPEAEGEVRCSLPGRKLSPEKNFVVHAQGDSMEETIHDGDLCVFEWADTARSGEIVLVRSSISTDENSAEYVIKKFKSHNVLESLNKKYEDIVLDEASGKTFRIAGIFRGVISKGL